jgi:phosphate transport system substrate-binding protein
MPGVDGPLASANPLAVLTPGTLLAGTYRVLRPVADGGMASLYEVEHLVTGAHRAVKVMRLVLAEDGRFSERLLLEARVGSRLRSDHVAKVIDAGVDRALGLPFIVMELLEGVTLAQELRQRGHFTHAEVREILRQICHALSEAHDQGIVHRDVKPANVFLARSGTAGFSFIVKVLDFGIAKVIADSSADPVALQLGTPAWMAPEQTEADPPISPRTDVWALGLLAYTLLTGSSFWSAAHSNTGSTASILREVILEPIVPPSVRAQEQGIPSERLPDGFDGWFLGCVARAPGQRFADGRAAFDALLSVLPMSPDEPPVRLVPSPSEALDRRGSISAVALRASADAPTTVQPPPGPVAHGRPWYRSRAAQAGLGALACVLAALGWLFSAPTVSGSLGSASNVAATPPAATTTALLRLHGSNTMGSELIPRLAEAFLVSRMPDARVRRQRAAPDEYLVEARSASTGQTERIEIAAHGSSTAFQALGAGAADLGMSSRPIRALEAHQLSRLGDLTSAGSEHVVAVDGVAIIVNFKNPITELTRTEAARIFTGQVRDWGAFGGFAGAIHVHARDDRSGTFDTFQHLVLGKQPLSPEAQRYEDSAELSRAVAADPYGIGFVGLAYVRSTKPLMIRDPGTVALLPAPVSVASEDYLLSRRLYLYAPRELSAPARDFLRFVQEDEAQPLIERSGFVDLAPECDSRAAECTDCSEAYRHLVRGACRVSVSFRFEHDSAELDNRARTDLARSTRLLSMAQYNAKRVILIGFADEPGGATASLRASQVMTDKLAKQFRARGLSVSLAVGLGRDRPLAKPGAPDARARNQRVELWLR